jgi:hypothetical protein
MASPTNQPRKDPFHLYCLSPHSPQFQQSAQQGAPFSDPAFLSLNWGRSADLTFEIPLGGDLIHVQYIISVREKLPTWSDQDRLSRVGTASVSILPPLEQDYTVLYTCWSYSYFVYVAERKKF